MRYLYLVAVASLAGGHFVASSAMAKELSCSYSRHCEDEDCHTYHGDSLLRFLSGRLTEEYLYANGERWQRVRGEGADGIRLESYLIIYPSGETKVLSIHGGQAIESSVHFDWKGRFIATRRIGTCALRG
jgi:hypothetical protein